MNEKVYEATFYIYRHPTSSQETDIIHEKDMAVRRLFERGGWLRDQVTVEFTVTGQDKNGVVTIETVVTREDNALPVHKDQFALRGSGHETGYTTDNFDAESPEWTEVKDGSDLPFPYDGMVNGMLAEDDDA